MIAVLLSVMLLPRPALFVGCGALVAIALALSRRRTRWWLRQRWLRSHLVEKDAVASVDAVRLVAGVDISFVKSSDTDACAALVVCDLNDAALPVVYKAFKRVVLTAPYIPGYLAFREVEFLCDLLKELRTSAPHLVPEVILVDGNGILHPNGFGLACHLGVLTGIPTVGVGKTLHHVDGLSKDTVKELSATLTARGEHVSSIVSRTPALHSLFL